jgi:hypothetical protein
MITPDYKQDELRTIWKQLLNLHTDMKLGNPIDHPMRSTVAALSEKVMQLSEDLNRCRIYVPEVSKFDPNTTQELATPTADTITPHHPTTNPNGD